jgi:hypothetical protein
MSLASLWSTGPAMAFVSMAGWGGVPRFLGTWEDPPEITIERSYQDVKNQLFGSGVPADRSYQGKEAMVTGVMNRFEFPTFLGLQQGPISAARGAAILAVAGAPDAAAGLGVNPVTAPYLEGSDVGLNYGSLMSQGGFGCTLWVYFPRSATVGGVGVTPGLIPGYRFLSAFLLGPDKLNPGTVDLKENVIFKCQRVAGAGGGPAGLAGLTPLTMTLNCWDHNMTAVAGLPFPAA